MEYHDNIIQFLYDCVNIVEHHEIILFGLHIIISWNSDKKFHEGGYMNLNDAIIKRIDGIAVVTAIDHNKAGKSAVRIGNIVAADRCNLELI